MEKKMPHQFLSHLISELNLLCYFILSHPLYFSYLVFFSPYLVKFFFFLSPLFFTTSLLLLALLTNTISPACFSSSSPDSHKVSSILLSLCHALLEADAKIDEFDHLEDFEVYKIVFRENPIEFFDYTFDEGSEKSVLDSSVQEKDSAVSATTVDLENSGVAVEELLKEMDELESKIWTDNVDRKKTEALGTKVDKVVEKQQKEEMTMMMKDGSKEVDKVKKAHSWSNLEQGYNNNNNNNLGCYGSMRKEKEWTRTLACKLYEERNNPSDSSGEGMDLLWETYELDSGKSKVKRDNSTTKKTKKKGESKSYKKDEEDDDYEEDINEQLCCLQALKFSARKMNIGMGRPNLVKISKAIRGFGWLHHVSKKNKVHCGDRF
ncbi:hypothetical protein P3L10_001103 [Capsicum annuum]